MTWIDGPRAAKVCAWTCLVLVLKKDAPAGVLTARGKPPACAGRGGGGHAAASEGCVDSIWRKTSRIWYCRNSGMPSLPHCEIAPLLTLRAEHIAARLGQTLGIRSSSFMGEV